MKAYVWVLASPRDERRFATTRPPGGEWVESLKKDGYVCFRIEFEMPAWWDTETAAPSPVQGIAKSVGYWSGVGENCARCARPGHEHVNLRCPGGVIPGFDASVHEE